MVLKLEEARTLPRPKQGRKPLIIASLLDIIKNDLQVGADWSSGVTCDEIAKRLYPNLWKTNEFKAKAKTRITIGRLRRLIPQIHKQMFGVAFLFKVFPFYSSKPMLSIKTAGKNPFGEYRYFFHTDPDALEQIRERMQDLSDALERQAKEIEATKRQAERERLPERKMVHSLDDIENVITELDPEQKQALIERIKKKLEK